MRNRAARLSGMFFLLAAWVAAGCGESSSQDPRGSGDPDLASMEASDEGVGKADGHVCEGLCAELRDQYGVRPRRYNGLFNCSCTAEQMFVEELPAITAFLNDQARAGGYQVRFTDAELASNFITEGGFFVLVDDRTDGIDGFNSAGIDTLVDNYTALRYWLHQVVRDAVDAGDRVVTRVNEKGEEVKTLTDLTFQEVLYANAGMYAWAKAVAARDIGNAGTNLDDLDWPVQYFWGTLYYNAGPGWGRKMLDKYGVTYHQKVWTREDDPYQYSFNARYNALWRTASFSYMQLTVYPDGAPVCPAWCDPDSAEPNNDPNEAWTVAPPGEETFTQGVSVRFDSFNLHMPGDVDYFEIRAEDDWEAHPENPEFSVSLNGLPPGVTHELSITYYCRFGGDQVTCKAGETSEFGYSCIATGSDGSVEARMEIDCSGSDESGVLSVTVSMDESAVPTCDPYVLRTEMN